MIAHGPTNPCSHGVAALLLCLCACASLAAETSARYDEDLVGGCVPFRQLQVLARVRSSAGEKDDVMSGHCRSASIESSVAGLWALSLLFPVVGFGQSSRASPMELVPDGAAQTAVQRTNEPVSYVLDALANRTYLIEIDQQGLDFVVNVRTPAGLIIPFNSPLERDERELVLLENTLAGRYEITLESHETTDASGSSRTRVRNLEGATDADLIAALRHMSAGAALYAADQSETRQQSIAEYRAAAEQWNALGRPRERAQALYSLAYLGYWVSYDFAESARAAAAAAEIYLNRLDDEKLHANSSLLNAAARIENLDFDAALAIAKDALARQLAMGNTYDAARAEELIGYAYQRKGDLVASATFRHDAAEHFAEMGEWFKELVPRARAAIIEADKGYSAGAIEILESVLERLPVDADPFFRAEVHDGLGDAYRFNGNINEALAHYQSALELHRRNGDSHGEADSLRGLGSTYALAGYLDLASQFLIDAAVTAAGLSLDNESLESRTPALIVDALRSLDEYTNVRTLELSVTALGSVEYLRGNMARALDLHRQALGLLQLTAPSESGYAQTMSTIDLSDRSVLIARDLTGLGLYEEAIKHIDEARSLLAGVDSPFHLASADRQLGTALIAEGQFSQAVDTLDAALAAYKSIGAEDGQAEVLYELAAARRATGDLELATQYGEEALDHIESVRARIAKPELRALFSATRHAYYEDQVDLMMERYHADDASDSSYVSAAWTVSERARARTTMDLLTEASVDLRRGVDEKLRARQRELHDELAARVFEQQSPGGASEHLLREIAEYESELIVLENRIRTTNPLYVGYSAVDPPVLADLQKLIDPDTVVVQYALGPDRSYAWIVTRDSIHGLQLAPRKRIERAVRQLLDELRSYPGDAAALRLARSELSGLVLAPVRDELVAKRVVIIADGALYYVPFAVLPLDPNDPDSLLVATHELIGLPSLSVLDALRDAHDSMPRAPKTIAVFADPVFSDADPRLSGIIESHVSVPTRDSQRGRYAVERQLARLPGTEYEAGVIENLVPEDQRLVAKAFDANRASVMNDDLDEYRYIHFATHGEVNTQVPSLSRLYFTNFDSNGGYRSGTLLLDDIYNLDLNADLVVLSACDTALGQEIRGEGLMGLTQGFLYAGAKSVLVSLWKVPDRATAELMKRFYTYLLDEDSSARPAEALRRAQASMAAERRWSDPYLWAAFVLLGDWR
jgi:CHAT domain-containing protein